MSEKRLVERLPQDAMHVAVFPHCINVTATIYPRIIAEILS